MKPIVVILLLLLPSFCFSANKYSRKHQQLTLSIFPEIGGEGYFTPTGLNGNKLYYGYNVGCNIEIRPLRNWGLTSGFTYNNFIKSIHYNEVPILLNYFAKNDLVLSLGSIIYLNSNTKQSENPKGIVGLALGMKKSNVGLLLYLNQNHPILSPNDNMKFGVGIGLKIELFRIQAVKV